MFSILENEYIVFLLVLLFLVIIFRIGKIVFPKDVYFIRHGETLLNKEHVRQGSEGGLSEEGKEQAMKTGLRLSKMHLEHMYVSPYERTQETAEIINQYTHIPVSYTPLLAERKNPTDIIGKKYDDLEVEKIVNQIDLSNHDPDFRFSDEENFSDMQQRAQKLLSFLAVRPYTRIVCVTHGIFLKMVLAHITYGARLTPLTHATLTYLTTVHNAGITLLRYNPWNRFLGKNVWTIVVFDDVSKL